MRKTFNLKNYMKAMNTVISLNRYGTEEQKKTAKENADLERIKVSEFIQFYDSKSRTRQLTPIRIYETLTVIEKSLGISKNAMKNVTVSVDVNAQDFPHAYKYIAYSTWFNAVYKNGGWTITDIYRRQTARLKHGTKVTLTDTARNAVLSRLTEF